MARFNWETPGSGLTHWGLGNEADAAAFFDQSFANSSRAIDPMGVQYSGFGPFQAAMSAMQAAPGASMDDVRGTLSQAQGQNTAIHGARQFMDEAREIFGDVDFMAMSPAQRAGVVDSVVRAREQQNQLPKRTGLLGYALPAMSALVGGPAFGGLVGAGLNAAKGNYLGAAGSLLGGVAFQQNPMGQSLWNQSQIGQSVNNLFSGNTTPSLPGGAPTSGISNPNAVPGGSTGITTPTGGGIVGSGQLNPAGVDILGNTAGSGINLGWSPLAVAGGATAMPGVTGLPTGGGLPGTNQIIGDAPTGSVPTPGSPDYLKYLDDLMTGMYSGMGLAQSPGSTVNALAGPATSGTGGNVGAGMLAAAGGVNDPGFLGQMSRLLGEQAGIGHKTRPGAYFNALGQIQPRRA